MSVYENHSHCAIGALEVAVSRNNHAAAGYDLASKQLALTVTGVHGGHIPRWNDAPGRTEGEVREAMMMAAKELRNSVNGTGADLRNSVNDGEEV